MKSAYELAMERLQGETPSVHLTDDQKVRIADIDSFYKAKAAEKEVFLNGEIAKAAGDPDEVEKIRKQLSSELRRLRDECEAKKDKVRQERGDS